MAELSRRDALTGTAAAAAGGLALATPALASVGEDAELKRLWAEWQEQFKQVCAALSAQGRAEEAYFKDRPSYPYAFFWVGANEHGTCLYERQRHAPSRPQPDPNERVFQCPPDTSFEDAVRIGNKRGSAESEAFHRADRTARKRHGVDEAEAASRAEWAKLRVIDQAITATPAEGIFGIGVKLAIWRHWQFPLLNEKPEEDEDTWPHEQPAIAAYYAAVVLTGVDFESQIRAIEGA